MSPKSTTFIWLATFHSDLPGVFIRTSMGIDDIPAGDPLAPIVDLLGDRETAAEVFRAFPEHIKGEPCPCQFIVDAGLDIFDVTTALEDLAPQIEEAQIARARWEAENVEESAAHMLATAEFEQMNPIARMMTGAQPPKPPEAFRALDTLLERFRRLALATVVAKARGCTESLEIAAPVRARFDEMVAVNVERAAEDARHAEEEAAAEGGEQEGEQTEPEVLLAVENAEGEEGAELGEAAPS